MSKKQTKTRARGRTPTVTRTDSRTAAAARKSRATTVPPVSDEMKMYAAGAIIGALWAVEDAINVRIKVSRQAVRTETDDRISDYHLGCIGALLCLKDDVEVIRTRLI